MVLANAAWTRLVVVRWQAGNLQALDAGPLTGRASFQGALACN